MSQTFSDPSALWNYARETAQQLESAGHAKAAEILDSAATFVTSSGWEWLYELASAVSKIEDEFQFSKAIGARLKNIQAAATSSQPYRSE